MIEKLEYIDKMAESLKSNSMGYLAIKMLSGLLQGSFSKPTGHPEIENLDDMFDYLETKHSLFKATVDNFKDYMARARNKVETAKMANTDLDCKVLADKFMHSDQISERLAFIRYICDSSKKIRLGADSLTVLWDELVTHSPVYNDAGLFYTWLRELCDRAAQLRKEPQTTVNVEDLVQFYNSKLEIWSKAEDEFKDLSLQGFHCIQSFFVLTNEIKGGLLRIPETYGVYQGKKPA